MSYAQWQPQHREVFGATDYDLVQYLSYRDRLGLITANATTPYILNFIDLGETGPLVVELPPGRPRAGCRISGSASSRSWARWGPISGRGGKHLIVPPGQDPPEVDDSFYVHQATGMNIMFGFRTLDPDPAALAGPGRRGPDHAVRWPPGPADPDRVPGRARLER